LNSCDGGGAINTELLDTLDSDDTEDELIDDKLLTLELDKLDRLMELTELKELTDDDDSDESELALDEDRLLSEL